MTRRTKQDDPRERQSEQRADQEAREQFDSKRPADVADVRTKASRHRKMTADKWNQ